jgi:hypothetical protein
MVAVLALYLSSASFLSAIYIFHSTYKAPRPNITKRDSFTSLLICRPHNIGTGRTAKAQSKKISMAEYPYENFVLNFLSRHHPYPDEGVQLGSQASDNGMHVIRIRENVIALHIVIIAILPQIM